MDIETISKFTTVHVRCSTGYSYVSWDCFDKPFSNFADFGTVLSAHLIHTLSCYQPLPSRNDEQDCEASLKKVKPIFEMAD